MQLAQCSMVKMTSRASARPMSVRQRLFARSPGPGTPGKRPVSEKPLPSDPISKPRTRPASRNLNDTFVSEQPHADPSSPEPKPKSKPARRDSIVPRVLSRARSCSALVAEPADTNDSPPPPRTFGLTRKLSRPFLPKRSASNRTDTHNRPFTAPARTLKSRSASIEQLKTLWANGRPRTQQSMAKPAPVPPSRPQISEHKRTHTNPESDGPDNMKDQISHFLKTDRVVEAWDNIAKTANCCGTTLAKTKDWPSSIFRTKSAENLHVPGSRSRSGTGTRTGTADANASRLAGSGAAATLERQMSWVQEPEFLSTYSFKQRPATSPRIHVLSIAIDEDLEKSFGSMAMNEDGHGETETGSIITALPAVVPTTPASMAARYRPRTVGAQA